MLIPIRLTLDKKFQGFGNLDSVGYLHAQNEEEEVDEGLAEGREVIKCVAISDKVTAFTVSRSLILATVTSLGGFGSHWS